MCSINKYPIFVVYYEEKENEKLLKLFDRLFDY